MGLQKEKKKKKQFSSPLLSFSSCVSFILHFFQSGECNTKPRKTRGEGGGGDDFLGAFR